MSFSLRHTFVTSDHHFGSWMHGPFAAFTKQQEDELVGKWNSVVGKDDIVIYNGDFCDGNVAELQQYLSRLNGKMMLLLGNHDTLPRAAYNAAFEDVEDELVIPELDLTINHMPVETSYKQIYGHLHRGENLSPLSKECNFCSCVQANDGYPVSLEHILLSFK